MGDYDAVSTLKSLAVMLGWANVPPRETLERSVSALKAQAKKNQREHDLVRQFRAEMFREELVTQEEYTALATEHGAVQRLEDYDFVRQRLTKLENAIKKHRDQESDDRCWLDDYELYEILGGPQPNSTLPDKATFMANCERFHHSRQSKMPYMPVDAKLDKAKKVITSMRDFILAQGWSLPSDLTQDALSLISTPEPTKKENGR